MRRRLSPLFAPILALGVAGSLAGCSGDSGQDVHAPTTARLEVVVDANVGEGRLAVDAPISARRLAVERSGDVLLAGPYAVYRIDARTGTLTAVPGTELTTCADGSSVETTCGTGIAAVAVDAAGRIYFGVGDGRILRVGREGGAATHVAGESFYRCPDRLPIAGPADEVCIGFISDLAFDRAGNLIIADMSQARILRFDPTAQTVTVVAGTGIGAGPCPEDVPAAEACVVSPTGITVDPVGGIVVASSDHVVRRIDPVTGIIGRIAGRAERCFDGDPRGDGGPARDACLWSVPTVAADDQGNLYLADAYDYRLRRIDAGTGTIATFDGADFDTTFSPGALAVDDDGRLFELAFTERYGGQQLRRFGAGPGSGTTIAGNGAFGFCGDGGPARDACLGYAQDVALGPDGAIYVADLAARRIRRVAGGIIATVAGNGLLASPGETCADGVAAIDTCLDAPAAVAVGADGFYVLDGTGDFGFNRVRRVDRRGTIDTVIGGCRVEGDAATVPAADACLHVSSIAIGSGGELWISEFERVSRFDGATGRLVPVIAVPPDCVPFNQDPTATCFPIRRIVFDRDGDLYLADGVYVRRVAAGTTTITIIGGKGSPGFCGDGGPATEACLYSGRIVPDGAGNVFVAAAGVVRRIDAATGIITTVAGSSAGHCPFNFGDVVPPGLGCATVHAIDDAGRLVYPELSRFTVGRVVRLDVPVGHPVP